MSVQRNNSRRVGTERDTSIPVTLLLRGSSLSSLTRVGKAGLLLKQYMLSQMRTDAPLTLVHLTRLPLCIESLAVGKLQQEWRYFQRWSLGKVKGYWATAGTSIAGVDPTHRSRDRSRIDPFEAPSLSASLAWRPARAAAASILYNVTHVEVTFV